MLMDNKTRELLEFEGVLADLHPLTPFGQLLKNNMKAFEVSDKAQLMEELDRVEKLKNLINSQRTVFVGIRTHMRLIKNIRRSVERCMAGGVLSIVEFFELKNFVYTAKSISEGQKLLHWNVPDKYRIKGLQWVEAILDPGKTGIKTFYIYDDYSGKLANIRKKKGLLENKLNSLKKEAIKKAEAELGISVRSSGEITVGKNQTDLIKKFKENSMLESSGETYINVTYRVRPDRDMLDLSEKIEMLKGEEAIEEEIILGEISSKISSGGGEILEVMDSIGEFDFIVAKAYLANAFNGVKPVICDDVRLKIVNGRHPLTETALRRKGKEFTPISLDLEKGVTLITGANMGGKTVSLKMAGLLSAMAQYGLLVPAEHMETGMNSHIYISAGDGQSTDMGLSTFGAEIKSVKEALTKSEEKGLILIDELSRGTNPHEGYAISKAIIGYLSGKPGITLVTSHFDGLGGAGVRHLQVKGLRNIDLGSIKEGDSISEYMDYALIEIKGEAGVPRDAINISRLMGIPEEILQQAEEIMKNN